MQPLLPFRSSRYHRDMYKAIFTDIDGTLFRDDLTIGQETREAIRESYANGIRIVLSSGRYITGMQRAQEQLGIPVIYAAINGALIKDGETYLREKRIGENAYIKAARFLKGRVSSLIAFCETEYAIDADDEWFSLQTRICGREGVRMDISNPEEVFRKTGERPYKILAKDNDREKNAHLLQELKEIIGSEGKVIASSWNNFEILPPDTDKSDALSIVSAHLGIKTEETIAFGDWDNDEGMIGKAGLGIAMENGSEKAKNAAAFITRTNNEEGIAYALRHFGVI